MQYEAPLLQIFALFNLLLTTNVACIGYTVYLPASQWALCIYLQHMTRINTDNWQNQRKRTFLFSYIRNELQPKALDKKTAWVRLLNST